MAIITNLNFSNQNSTNFGTNINAESGAGGVNLYNDGALSSPVDGTSGTVAGMTVTVTSSAEALRGLQSFLVTKDSQNRLGQGWSYDFSIDANDRGRVIEVTFDYNVVDTSGFFTYLDGSTNSDVTMWVYDVTNNTVKSLSPSSYNISKGKYRGIFQAASNSSSYRLIWHVGNSNTNAWKFIFDNILIHPADEDFQGVVEVNAVDNPYVAYSISGWSAAATSTHSISLDTNNSPLAPSIPTCLAIRATGAETESSTSGAGYKISQMPPSLRQTKTKLEFWCAVPAGETWKVSVYANGTTRVPLLSDSSGSTALPSGYSGKFGTVFDSNTSASYSVRVTKTSSGTSTLYLTNLVVGPGIVTVTQAEAEYAYNTGTTVAAGGSDLTNFGYGLAGSTIPAINSVTANSETTFRVRFTKAILASDSLVLRVLTDNTTNTWREPTDIMSVRQGTSRYGVTIERVSGSNTDVDVKFGNMGARPTGTTYAAAGQPWSDFTGYRWRVDKVTSGQAVGLGFASDTQTGLVSITGQTFAGSKTFQDPAIISVSNDSLSALRITQSGTGNALLIEDSSSPDSTPFVIDNSGKVGVGTASPSSKLEIIGESTSVLTSLTQQIDSGSLFFNTTNANAVHHSGLFWRTADTAKPKVGIWMYTENDAGSWLHLGTSNSYATGITNTALSINPSGNVGIGTTSPGARLDVNGTAIISANSTSPGLTITQTGTGDSLLVQDSANPDATPFVIDTTGNVCIGTGIPTQKLTVAGNGVIAGINLTSSWSGLATSTTSEISNDTSAYKTLMIIGNNSADGTTRSVSIWDRLTVNGSLSVTSTFSLSAGSSIRQNSSNWTGDAPAGIGKLEYHSNRWYINAGSDSALVAQFRRGGIDVSHISNSGAFVGSVIPPSFQVNASFSNQFGTLTVTGVLVNYIAIITIRKGTLFASNTANNPAAGNAIPSGFRPAVDVRIATIVYNNSTYMTGAANVDTGGTITLTATPGSGTGTPSWTATGNKGLLHDVVLVYPTV